MHADYAKSKIIDKQISEFFNLYICISPTEVVMNLSVIMFNSLDHASMLCRFMHTPLMLNYSI